MFNIANKFQSSLKEVVSLTKDVIKNAKTIQESQSGQLSFADVQKMLGVVCFDRVSLLIERQTSW